MNRQIVIEIDNKAFNFIKEYSFVENTEVMLKQSVEDRVKTLMLFDMINALKNGTPLPKGHGRIGDIDELMDIIGLKDNEEYRAYNYGEVITLEDIDRLNVIIEPDKEVSE